MQQVPSIDAKFYAATQVIDEARHVEAYSRLLHDKFELAYPITPTLLRLLQNVLADSRWDMTYLGMQVLIEGLALAAFAQIRDTSQNPLAASVRSVMQDEPGTWPSAASRCATIPSAHQPSATSARSRGRGLYLMRYRFHAEVWRRWLPVRSARATARAGSCQSYVRHCLRGSSP